MNGDFKKRIVKNNFAKIIDWKEIITRSKLKPSLFHRAWRLYSNYAHSEYLSLMQVKDYWAKANDTYFIRNLCLFSSLVLNTITIIDYKKLYPQIESAYSGLEGNQKRIINLLNSVGKEAT